MSQEFTQKKNMTRIGWFFIGYVLASIWNLYIHTTYCRLHKVNEDYIYIPSTASPHQDKIYNFFWKIITCSETIQWFDNNYMIDVQPVIKYWYFKFCPQVQKQQQKTQAKIRQWCNLQIWLSLPPKMKFDIQYCQNEKATTSFNCPSILILIADQTDWSRSLYPYLVKWKSFDQIFKRTRIIFKIYL